MIDRLAKEGDSSAFAFSKPHVKGEFDYSFSGLKTSFLYTLRDRVAEDPDFVEKHKADLCASLQKTIIDILRGNPYWERWQHSTVCLLESRWIIHNIL